MAIMVHYKDNTVSFVPDRELVELILADSIVAFRRGAEWISLDGTDIPESALSGDRTRGERKFPASTADVWRRIIVAETC
jgi:hypothetical protein